MDKMEMIKIFADGIKKLSPKGFAILIAAIGVGYIGLNVYCNYNATKNGQCFESKFAGIKTSPIESSSASVSVPGSIAHSEG